jgi:hypothetical protein
MRTRDRLVDAVRDARSVRRRIAFTAAAALAVVSTPEPTPAAPPKLPRRPTVVAVDTPTGLQGVAGAGASVVLPFRLFDRRRRRSDVEVQYGWDLNGDGLITDGTERGADRRRLGCPNEWRTATEDRLDPRDTRGNRAPRLYESGVDDGAANAYVWRTMADLPRGGVFLSDEIAIDVHGRPVPDPDNPGSFLAATGPDGAAMFAGVKLRVRAFRRGHGRRAFTGWVVTRSFDVDDDSHPSMTIDAVANDAASPRTVLVNWTAFDADSEDFNGDGRLDVDQAEDLDSDGVLDDERVGVAFDFHRLGVDEDPASMTDAQLAVVTWSPCTRMAGVGDTDSLDARPGAPIPTTGDLAGVASAPSPVGRQWLFAWDSAKDVGATSGSFILRATPFDQKRRRGERTWSRIVVRPGT